MTDARPASAASPGVSAAAAPAPNPRVLRELSVRDSVVFGVAVLLGLGVSAVVATDMDRAEAKQAEAQAVLVAAAERPPTAGVVRSRPRPRVVVRRSRAS